MKTILTALILVGTAYSSIGQGATDAAGIKTVNLRNADLDLLNNHDPASQIENFDLLPGYQVNLFAADPMLANPIHMQWDSGGRLWVACSWSYPQIKPGDVANDKIIILEDTDGDGVADKSTVFADGLYLPTGFELANGGCYVGQSPDVFFLKDTDGDDVADVKELALTGFGIEDSHHSISAFRRGPGGWIYFQEGIFLHAQVETQYGMVRNFNGGVYQYNPRTQELRVFATGTGGNPWGHVFDEWGQSFMVNNPRIIYLSPVSGNSGESVRVQPLISTDKQCGGDLALGTHVGDDLRGQLLTGRFKSRMVVRYEFIEDGAGFSANVLAPLMSSKHPNFRPVDVKMGPDGAIYVADWYNSIINHANHDFRDPRRDHEHGRIWRITHKERPLAKKPQLVGISIPALLDQLKSPEAWTRGQARKELSERDPDEVLRAAESWVEELDTNSPNYDHHLVEAMWTCQNVERISEPILTRVVAAKSGHARSAAARILRYWYGGVSDPIAMIASLADDPFPRTRMEAVLSAGFIPRAEAYAAALHAIDHPTDRALDLALPQTKKALEKYLRPAMEAGAVNFAKASHQAYAEMQVGIGFGQRLRAFLRNPNPDAKEIDAIKTQLLTVGTNEDVAAVFAALARDGGLPSTDATLAMLETLHRQARGNRDRELRQAAAGLHALLDHADDSIAVIAGRNIGDWNADAALPDLWRLLQADDRSIAVRQAAAVAFAQMGNIDDLKQLGVLARKGDIKTRYAALPGMFRADRNVGLEMAVELFEEDPADVDPVPALQTILQSRGGSRMLGEKLAGATLHPVVKERVIQFHRASGQLPTELVDQFQPDTMAVASLSAALLAESEDALVADVVNLGNPFRGEMIFRRPELACVSCHAIGPAGPRIGPDLVAVGSAAPPQYMVESILEPDAAIAEHYENRLFTLRDGSVRMGVIAFQNEQQTVIRDSSLGGQEVTLEASDISRSQVMPSLMPAGLADQLNNRQEFLDLANFLSVLGKAGDFANDESPVIRKWQVAANTGKGLPGSDATWTTAYSKVNGELPTEDFGTNDQVALRGAVNVQVAGDLLLAINQPRGLRLWVDDVEISDPTAVLKLTPGRKVLTFSVDRKSRDRDAGLRVEFVTPPGSAIKLQPEGGI
ncbi:MAG: hypothetical protein SynsKO_06500 [Synoicihabitans sp.]